MYTPLISVVIPAYNLASLIGKTLDSVLSQTYPNMEVIVVDDGSTDNTWKVISVYAEKDARIKAVRKENGGVTSARLRGVAEATGNWIGFVDGDDYIEPNMYERLYANAVKYEADISHCGYQMVFPNRVDFYYNTGRTVLQDNIQGISDLIAGNFIEPGLCNKLFRKELFVNLDMRMDKSIKINEDLLMNYWLFKAANAAVYEDFCPYHYMVRKGSAANSNISEHKLWNPLHVAEILLNDVPAGAKPAAVQKMIRLLINGATIDVTPAPALIVPYQNHTRQMLRERLRTILKGRECNAKLKIMALWAAIWPVSYRWVHTLYAKITGHDKIYDID